jgi:hypothetical protein
MTTSAVPLSMAYSEYPARPSAASNCPAGISASDAMLATAASSSSGKPAKKRIAASRNVSIFPRLHSGSYLRDLAPRPLLRAASSSPGAWAPTAWPGAAGAAGRCRVLRAALAGRPRQGIRRHRRSRDVPLITVSLAYQQQPVVADGIGIPRDGGMANLLAEAGGPAPAFAAVVCEDINRSARDTFNALKLEKNSPPAASPCSPPTSPSSSKAPTPPPSCCAG